MLDAHITEHTSDADEALQGSMPGGPSKVEQRDYFEKKLAPRSVLTRRGGNHDTNVKNCDWTMSAEPQPVQEGRSQVDPPGGGQDRDRFSQEGEGKGNRKGIEKETVYWVRRFRENVYSSKTSEIPDRGLRSLNEQKEMQKKKGRKAR